MLEWKSCAVIRCDGCGEVSDQPFYDEDGARDWADIAWYRETRSGKWYCAGCNVPDEEDLVEEEDND